MGYAYYDSIQRLWSDIHQSSASYVSQNDKNEVWCCLNALINYDDDDFGGVIVIYELNF